MNTDQFQLRIPEPCNESWDKMSPVEQGRFCSSCAKKVVDFSQSEKTEAMSFMAAHKDADICGRVPAGWITPELSMTAEHKTSLGRFALALLLTFGSFLFSFGQHESLMLGEVVLVENHPEDTLSLKDTLVNNTTLPVLDTTVTGQEEIPVEQIVIMGMIRSVPIREEVIAEPKEVFPVSPLIKEEE